MQDNNASVLDHTKTLLQASFSFNQCSTLQFNVNKIMDQSVNSSDEINKQKQQKLETNSMNNNQQILKGENFQIVVTQINKKVLICSICDQSKQFMNFSFINSMKLISICQSCSNDQNKNERMKFTNIENNYMHQQEHNLIETKNFCQDFFEDNISQIMGQTQISDTIKLIQQEIDKCKYQKRIFNIDSIAIQLPLLKKQIIKNIITQKMISQYCEQLRILCQYIMQSNDLNRCSAKFHLQKIQYMCLSEECNDNRLCCMVCIQKHDKTHFIMKKDNYSVRFMMKFKQLLLNKQVHDDEITMITELISIEIPSQFNIVCSQVMLNCQKVLKKLKKNRSYIYCSKVKNQKIKLENILWQFVRLSKNNQTVFNQDSFNILFNPFVIQLIKHGYPIVFDEQLIITKNQQQVIISVEKPQPTYRQIQKKVQLFLSLKQLQQCTTQWLLSQITKQSNIKKLSVMNCPKLLKKEIQAIITSPNEFQQLYFQNYTTFDRQLIDQLQKYQPKNFKQILRKIWQYEKPNINWTQQIKHMFFTTIYQFGIQQKSSYSDDILYFNFNSLSNKSLFIEKMSIKTTQTSNSQLSQLLIEMSTYCLKQKNQVIFKIQDINKQDCLRSHQMPIKDIPEQHRNFNSLNRAIIQKISGKQLKVIVFNRPKNKIDEICNTLFKNKSSIHTIIFHRCQIQYFKYIEDIQLNCPNAQVICFDGMLISKSIHNKIKEIKETIKLINFIKLKKLNQLVIKNCLVQDLETVKYEFQHLTNLQYLKIESIVNQNDQIHLKQLCSSCKQLKYLNLSNNQLLSIQGFKNCNQVIYFSCSNNKLKQLDGLSQFVNLQIFDCSNSIKAQYLNRIIFLKGLSNCLNLKQLYCKNNKIQSLEGLHNLKYLELIDCSHNQLVTLQGLQKCRILKKLYCNNNVALTELKGIERCINIQDLSAYSCKITSLKPLSNFIYLKQLLCYYNITLKSLQGLQKCYQLLTLQCYQSGIRTLEGIQNCTKLITLECQINNNLQSLKQLRDCQYLKRLSCQGSLQMKNLQGLEKSTKLEILQFSTNQIKSLKEIRNCVSLKILKFKKCLVTSLEYLSACQQLEKLICSQNQIKSLHGLQNCVNLKELQCSNNLLTSLKQLKNCKKLQILNVANYENFLTVTKSKNKIVAFEGLQNMFTLKKLSIKKNPIKQFNILMSIQFSSLVLDSDEQIFRNNKQALEQLKTKYKIEVKY